MFLGSFGGLAVCPVVTEARKLVAERTYGTHPQKGTGKTDRGLQAMNLEFQLASEVQLPPCQRVSHFARYQQVAKGSHKNRLQHPSPDPLKSWTTGLVY